MDFTRKAAQYTRAFFSPSMMTVTSTADRDGNRDMLEMLGASAGTNVKLTSVGALEGWLVGCPEGCKEGAPLGTEEGAHDGCEVGDVLGWKLG